MRTTANSAVRFVEGITLIQTKFGRDGLDPDGGITLLPNGTAYYIGPDRQPLLVTVEFLSDRARAYFAGKGCVLCGSPSLPIVMVAKTSKLAPETEHVHVVEIDHGQDEYRRPCLRSVWTVFAISASASPSQS